MKENHEMKGPAPEGRQASRPTLGMLTNWLGGLYQVQWLGAVDAAHKHQANLITFPGRELGRPDNFYAQANVIFDLISPAQIDGLIIWTTTLQAFVGQQEMEQFCRHFQPLPMVSVEQAMAGLPSLLMDNKHGMRAAVSHLIEVHGCRRIAFIRGPVNHPGAQERYQGYVEALTQHGLPLDPTLVAPPVDFWRPEQSAALVHQLLIQQPAKIEAIVAANDYLALGVLSALQARGVQVPNEMAVIGFDNGMYIDLPDLGLESMSDDWAGVDVERAVTLSATTLPLTTVQPPFYELGWQAVELLLAQLRGEPVPEVVTIPTELIVRRSCGCFSEGMGQMPPELLTLMPPLRRPLDVLHTPAIAAQWEPIITQIQQALGPASIPLAPGWAERLLTAFISEVQGESAHTFLAVLDELVRTDVAGGGSLERWWQVLFVLRRQILPHLTTAEILARAEELWQRTHTFMQEITERFFLYQQLLLEKQNQILGEIGQKLITTLDIDQLVEIMAQELSNLRIRRCYLALYEVNPPSSNGAQAASGAGEKGYPTAWSRSILVYEDKQRLQLAPHEAIFPSRQLAPGERLHRERPYSMVVEPLYFKDQQLGFVLFELGLRTGWVYEALRGQLSSALQGALLVEREKRALAEVLAAQKQTKKLAAELATVAEVSTAASTILEINQLLQTVVDLTKGSFGLYHTHLYLLNDSGDTLILAAGAGEKGQQMVATGWRIPLEREQSLVARAARYRRGIIANDVRKTSGFLPNPLLPQTRSEMAVPMIVRDKVLGVLDVQSEQANRFTEEDVRIQTTLAAQVAVAVENARLYNQARQEIAERQQAEAEREKLIVELQAALTKIKTLRGLIPICASCKKIRDDQGYWTQLEVYLRDHSEANFSHGICPDCKKNLYPDFYKDDV